MYQSVLMSFVMTESEYHESPGDEIPAKKRNAGLDKGMRTAIKNRG
jgi:hypothetical protein